jgi:AraC family transcriptional regulator
MDLLKNMNGAIKYIEENLTNDIDFKEVARWLSAPNTILKGCFPFLQVLRYRNTSAADALLLQHLSLKEAT